MCVHEIPISRSSGRQVPTKDKPRAAVLVSAILFRPGDLQGAGPGQNDVLDVGEAGVALHDARRAKGLFDLGLHLRLGVLHEDGGVGVALAHLLLALVWVEGAVRGAVCVLESCEKRNIT